MRNHQPADIPAIPRAFCIVIALEVALVVYFAVTGDWSRVIVFAVLALSAFVSVPIYKRLAAERDADAQKAESTSL